MCQPASFIVSKGPKAFWSKQTDRHTDIRKEHGLPENGIGGIVNVQVEIVPDGNDYALPLNQWKFIVDQDQLPTWWDAKEAEKECRCALEGWAKARLVRFGEVRQEVKDGENVLAVYGTVESVSGNGTVKYVSGNGTVESVSGNGTVKYVSGNGTVESVSGNGTVKYVSGNGTVKYVYGNGTVESVSGNAVVQMYNQFATKLSGIGAIIVDRTQPKVRGIVGTEKERVVKSKGWTK